MSLINTRPPRRLLRRPLCQPKLLHLPRLMMSRRSVTRNRALRPLRKLRPTRLTLTASPRQRRKIRILILFGTPPVCSLEILHTTQRNRIYNRFLNASERLKRLVLFFFCFFNTAQHVPSNQAAGFQPACHECSYDDFPDRDI